MDTRVSSVTNSVTNTFLRDGAYVTDPVVKDSNATYTPGISERRSGTNKLLSHNLRSVDSQTTTSQSVAASKVYDAFGNVTSSTGTFVGPFGYGGGFGCQEEATGLKLLGHRMYDSSTGRFLTRDPIKDGRNWYVYCGSDPVGRADRDGLLFTNIEQFGEAFVKWLPFNFDRWWNGEQVVDQEGYPVVIDGKGNWNLINPVNNAITPNGVTHINEADRDDYFNDKWWRDHEHCHVHQKDRQKYCPAEDTKTLNFVISIAIQYLLYGGHDGARLEQEADRYANEAPTMHLAAAVFI